jgi:hypothetical protein
MVRPLTKSGKLSDLGDGEKEKVESSLPRRRVAATGLMLLAAHRVKSRLELAGKEGKSVETSMCSLQLYEHKIYEGRDKR